MDRDSYIKARLQEHYVEALSVGKELIVVSLQGSQNYNLDLYTDEYKSDIDTKAIVLPSFDDFCNSSKPFSHTHVRGNEEHIDMKDIRVMFDTFKKQNINFVEILFSDWYVVNEKYKMTWDRLRDLGEDLVHCHPAQTLRTMAGMCYEKHKALCHPYPTIKHKIDKYGYDGKQLHHIIRVHEFMKNYLSGRSFKECLTATGEVKDLLIEAKLNMFSLDAAIKLADENLAAVDKLKADYIEKYGDNINPVPYKILEDIKLDTLKQWFKEQLLN